MAPLAGWQYGIADRLGYNASINSTDSYWKRSLPTVQANRVLHPMSDAWRRDLCLQMDIDPDTSQAQAYVDMLPGYAPGRAQIKPEGHNLYIVDDQVPKREIRNGNSTQWSTTYGGGNYPWANVEQAVLDRNGGFPVPLDVIQNGTPDKYVHTYQPSTNSYLEMGYALPTDMASITLTKSGSPTSGTFKLVLNYNDHLFFTPQDFTTAAIPYNASSVQVRTAIEDATNAGGARLGHTGFALDPFNEDSGGPLNVAPVTWKCRVATPSRAIGVTVTNVTFNTGTVIATSHAAGPIDFYYNGAVIVPGGGRNGLAEFFGTYEDFIGTDGLQWQERRDGGSASSIGYVGGLPSVEEAVAANAAGTGLSHAVPLLLGTAQDPNATGGVGWLWPATRTDGWRNDPAAVPEGSRITFPADVDLSAVAANTPEMMWLARTIRDKGAITYDVTRGGVEFEFRTSWYVDGVSGTNHLHSPSWFDVLPRYVSSPGSAAWDYMTWLPWHKAQIYTPDFSLPGDPVTPPPVATGAYWGMRL